MNAVHGEKSIEMNILTWALAVDKTARATKGPDSTRYEESPVSETFADLPADALEALESELLALGMTDDDGAVTPDWQEAIRQATEAPLKAAVVTRSAGVSTHCDLSLSRGEGLARQTSRAVHEQPDGAVVVDEIHDRMVVTRFSQEDLWAVVARSMPDLPELLSTDLPPVTGEERIPVTPAELADLDRDTRATVHFSLAAGEQVATGDPEAQAPVYQSGHIWVLTDRLLEVKTAPDPGDPSADAGRHIVLLPEEPGVIARQLVWDVLGAQQFLAGTASAEGGVK